MQVSEAIDGWQRFLDLHAAVTAWCGEKRDLCDRPEEPATLSDARQRSQDLQAAAKSARYAAKNAQEMAREHARIAQVAEASELADKLAEAEAARTEVEGLITKKVRTPKVTFSSYSKFCKCASVFA